jgi:hypothetical protein
MLHGHCMTNCLVGGPPAWHEGRAADGLWMVGEWKE